MFSRCAVGEEDFGELSIEDGLDEDKVVSEEDAAEAQKLKGQANTAFSRKSDLLPLWSNPDCPSTHWQNNIIRKLSNSSVKRYGLTPGNQCFSETGRWPG